MKTVLILGDASSIHLKKWLDPLCHQFDVYLITFSKTNVTSIPTENVSFIDIKIRNKLKYFLALPLVLKLAKKINPDIVHAHYASSYGLVGRCIPVNFRVLSAWGSDINDCTHSAIRRALMKWTLAGYNVVNCASKQLEIAARKISNKPDFQTFQYGVNLELLPLRNVHITNQPVFISNRGFDPLYHIDDLIRGFDQYLKHDGKGILHIFGFGSDDDYARVNQLINIIKSDCIIFHGTVSNEELCSFMRNAQYYFSIPDKDGAPLSLYEAMYIGLLPILSDIPSNRESLDGGDAIFLDGYQPACFETAIYNALKKNTGDYIGNNRDLVIQKYNYQTNIKKMMSIYKCSF